MGGLEFVAGHGHDVVGEGARAEREGAVEVGGGADGQEVAPESQAAGNGGGGEKEVEGRDEVGVDAGDKGAPDRGPDRGRSGGCNEALMGPGAGPLVGLGKGSARARQGPWVGLGT